MVVQHLLFRILSSMKPIDNVAFRARHEKSFFDANGRPYDIVSRYFAEDLATGSTFIIRRAAMTTGGIFTEMTSQCY